MSRRLLTALLATAGTVSVAWAGAVQVQGGGRVYDLGDGVFEVVQVFGGSADGWEVWCSGADYARRELSASWRDSVYIYRGIGPSVSEEGLRSVLFTMDPSTLSEEPTVMQQVYQLHTGHYMSISDGNTLCNALTQR